MRAYIPDQAGSGDETASKGRCVNARGTATTAGAGAGEHRAQLWARVAQGLALERPDLLHGGHQLLAEVREVLKQRLGISGALDDDGGGLCLIDEDVVLQRPGA